MQKLISVIVPIYNTGEYLPECLDSILNQSYPHLEVLLINDGSTDDSGKIADLYAAQDNRVKVFHKPNGGVSSARNLGIDQATGDYIAFVDSDDAIRENYFESLLGYAQEYDADICFCIAQTLGEPVQSQSKVEHHSLSGDEAVRHLLKADLFGCGINKMYKSKLFGSDRFSKSIAVNEDLLLNYTLFCRANRVLVFRERLYLYREREGSASRSGFNKKQLDSIKVTRIIMQDIADGELKKLAQSRYLQALTTSHKGALTSPQFKAERKWIEGLIRESFMLVVRDPYISFPRKGELLMQGFLPTLYQLLFNLVKNKDR